MILFFRWAQCIGRSGKLMLQYNLKITPEICQSILSAGELGNIPFRNVSLQSFKEYENLSKFSKIIKNMKKSIQILYLEDFRRNRVKEVVEFFSGFSKLRVLKLKNCHFCEEVSHQILRDLPELVEVSFEKCDGNFFKIFHRQKEITKLLVRNPDWTWNGFSHEDFNDLVKTLPKIDFIALDGSGTGSYFDCDNFPYHIRKLETSMITFHWYVGIKTARKNFLDTQKKHLKELTIHQLPFDFDGGKVIKFIVEQMELDRFYYGKIPLIYDRQIQHVQEFMANEIQICAMYEMFRQFPCMLFLFMVKLLI